MLSVSAVYLGGKRKYLGFCGAKVYSLRRFNMKDKIFGVLQRVGRSFMLPIAILPVAGLFLGIGSSFTNETMLSAYRLSGIMGEGTWIYSFLKVLSNAGSIVFDNLPLLFAMGVAIGMAKKEKEVAALSSAVAFLIMHTTISAMLEVTGSANSMMGSTAEVLGITTLQMGVFGGIIVGLGVAALHNRFHKIQLPQVLSFFGGSRFVPIISSVVYLFVGILMFFIWPYVQTAIGAIGNLVKASGYLGTLIYGIAERALIPFGLHHVFYMPFWQTDLGGVMEVMGQQVAGAQNIFFAQLGDPSVSEFSVEATRFMAGKFPFMIFGLPGAALAMYRCAKTKKRKVVGGLLLSAALTSMLTGITEPIEFTFLFVAPLLYVVHCVLAGASYMLMHIFNVGVGMTFSGGLIDLTLFGILQGNDKTHWIWIVIVGVVYFVIYYFLFKTLITKLNLNTPGRESDFEEPKLYTRADMNAKNTANAALSGLSDNDMKSALITHGLGGVQNISDVDCCATRLRITVYNSGSVREDVLKMSGAAGVIIKGNGVQIIYGPSVTVVKSNLEDFLSSPIANDVENMFETAGEEAAGPQMPSEEPKEEKRGAIIIKAPEKGKVVNMSYVPDDVFASNILGQGAAIEPSEGKVISPVNGKVGATFDTSHAVGLISDDGVELFIHVGVDTVKLNGKHFKCMVEKDQDVKVGDTLIEFDIEGIKSEGYPVITPVIVSNIESFGGISLIPEEGSSAEQGDDFLRLS